MADSWENATYDANPPASWDSWADGDVDVSKIKLPGLGGQDDGAEETVKQVALDDDDDVPVQNVVDVSVAESQPKNEDKVRGLQPLAQIKKKAANKAKQKKGGAGDESVREEMTPAQLKARQRELEENADMMAAADTFGFDVDGQAEAEAKPAPKAVDFFEVNKKGGKEAYGKLASKLSAKLLEFQDDLHYMHLVTELAKNLCTGMSVEQIADLVAAMEVVKNAKRTVERGGIKKKKKGPVGKGKAAGREDMVEDEYDSFL